MTFTDGGGVVLVNSLRFLHGQGDAITGTRVKIYGLPGLKNDLTTDIADACYSNGGDLLGTLDIDDIIGLNISEYQHNVIDEETSFGFTFETNIEDNLGLYYETALEDDRSKLATIRFCVMMELLRPDGADVAVVNYAEFAFGYNATLDGTINYNAYWTGIVLPKDEKNETVTYTCEVDAYECDEIDNELDVQGVLR